MYLPLWVMLVIIIVLVAIYFVIFQPKDIRLIELENKAHFLLDKCGYKDITKPKIIKADKTYIIGEKDRAVIIYLEKEDDKLLIAMLAHLVPDIDYNIVVEKIMFCATINNIIKDPFI